MAQKAGKRLNEPYESAPTMKDIRLYMFKDKYAIFKMQAGKSVPEMSHRLNLWWTRLESSWVREKRTTWLAPGHLDASPHPDARACPACYCAYLSYGATVAPARSPPHAAARTHAAARPCLLLRMQVGTTHARFTSCVPIGTASACTLFLRLLML
jgi:hypothetical protein